jgi:hypothetical protein
VPTLIPKENITQFEVSIFQDPTSAYRSAPFWSWNDKLEPEELHRQIGEMKRAGLGGFFMHTRQGLGTPYMGEEFLDAVEVTVEEAKVQGLEAWCYDENGWPSGTANGVVPALGVAYQQKSLEGIKVTSQDSEAYVASLKQDADFMYLLVRQDNDQQWRIMRDASSESTDGVATADWEEGIAVMCRVNPYYIDILSENAMEAFLQACHEVYYQRLGDRFGEGGIPGIFTDEFKFSGIPWSPDLERDYNERYGEPMAHAVGWLFTEVREDPAALEVAYQSRYQFWRLVSDRFR